MLKANSFPWLGCRNIIFGDFLRMGIDREERKYEEVVDYSKLLTLLEDYLDEYNLSSTNALNLGKNHIYALHRQNRNQCRTL